MDTNAPSNSDYHVKWKNHLEHKNTVFADLLSQNQLIDVTLFCEGQKIGAHKVLLSACSLYFRDVFKVIPVQQQPVVIIYGIKYRIFQDILKFIYTGEVSIENEKLEEFFKAAKLLQICGLIDTPQLKRYEQIPANMNSEAFNNVPATPVERSQPFSNKRLRLSPVNIETTNIPSTENNMLDNGTFLADVKSEPLDLGADEDPLADPLQEEAIPTNSNITIEEDVKLKHILVAKEELKPVTKGFTEESLVCPECNKRFSHPYSLQHHKAVHSGSTQCPICNAVLSRKYNLKMHMKARHNT